MVTNASNVILTRRGRIQGTPVAFKASVATGCLQTVMIEPKMLTQSVKALSDQRK